MALFEDSCNEYVPTVPFERVAKFVRRLTHEIRNEFGALDLEAAYLAQAANDPVTSAEVAKLRKIVTEATLQLKRLSAMLSPIQPRKIRCGARMFLDELRVRLSKSWPGEMKKAAWSIEAAGEEIEMDFEMLASAFTKVFENAFYFREEGLWMEFRAFGRDGNMVFELLEGKKSVPSPPETWGFEPFVTTREDAYGLGLFFARRVIDAHRGRLVAHHDAERGILATQIVLPVEKS